jgi:hypothetical protein
MCNEFAAQGGCTSSDVKTTQTYGPLRSSHIYSKTPVVEGKSISWIIEGTSNGDAAIIDFQAQGGPVQTIRLQSAGAFRIQTAPVATADYNERQSMAFTLYDDAPAGRGEFRDGATAESGDPPPPTLNLFKGTACSDNDDDAAPDCQSNIILDPACDGPTCARLHFTTAGWTSNFSCTISQSSTWNFRGESRSFDSADGVKTTDWYFGSGYVQLTCRSNKQEVTSGISW